MLVYVSVLALLDMECRCSMITLNEGQCLKNLPSFLLTATMRVKRAVVGDQWVFVLRSEYCRSSVLAYEVTAY